MTNIFEKLLILNYSIQQNRFVKKKLSQRDFLCYINRK